MQPHQNSEEQPQTPATGFVFHPGDTLEVSHQAAQPTPTTTSTQPPTQQPQQTTIAQPIPQTPQTLSEPEDLASKPQTHSESGSIHWTASEYIDHQKGLGWYVLLIFIAIVLTVVVFLLTHDYISGGMIVIVAIIFGSFAVKHPKVLDYSIDDSGLLIGGKQYPYGIFKSFSVIEEGAINSIQLLPMKRFMPAISIYCATKDEDKILDKLADFLPFEETKQDLVDQFMRRIRF